jgi:KDO2-lipid IV(A) lauroyltransferase
MTQLPKFTAALLHPRYWLTWLGIGFLWLLVQLPYPVIFRLGKFLGRFAQLFMKRRARIAYRNLELFSADERARASRYGREEFRIRRDGAYGNRHGVVLAGQTHGPLERGDGNRHGACAYASGQPDGRFADRRPFLTLEIGARMFGMQAPALAFIVLTITRSSI